MAKKSQVCVACGLEKGKDDFDRFEGGKVWSPTCHACAAEHERLRLAAAEEAQRAREHAAAAERQRRQQILKARQAEEEQRRAEWEAAQERAAQAPDVHEDAVVARGAGEVGDVGAEEAAARDAAAAEMLASMRRQEARLEDLAARVQRWELFHHPVKTVALGMIAGMVVAGMLYGAAFLSFLFITGGLAALSAGTTTGRGLGVLGLMSGALVMLAILLWLLRLLRR